MKRNVIIDASVLATLLNKNDTYHQWAVTQLKDIQPPLLTCEAIISEVSFLIECKQQGIDVIFNYLKLGIIELPFCFSSEYVAIEKLMLKYADVPISFADACLVRMSEQHRNSCVFTLESDFLVYRKNNSEVIPLIYPDFK
jgi:predicted nucleic acid-binding protein